MDIMSLLKSGSTMAANSFVGDAIHDWVERVRGKNDGGSTSTPSERKLDKVKPFLGLAVLSHEEEYKFTRLWQKLDDNQKAYLSAFLLEYYLKPAQTGGIFAKVASWWLYDTFMLLTVNRSSEGRQIGSGEVTTTEVTDTPRVDRTANRSAFQPGGKMKTVNVDRTSTTGGTKTTTTTKESKEHRAPGGNEALAFLVELAYTYEIGGVKPAEEYLQVHKMPLMDSVWLAKADTFIKGIPSKIAELVPEAGSAITNLRDRSDAIDQANRERGGLTGFLMRFI